MASLPERSVIDAITAIYPVSTKKINERLTQFVKKHAGVRSLAEAGQFPYREDVWLGDGFAPSILIEVEPNTHLVVHAVSEEYLDIFMRRFRTSPRTRAPKFDAPKKRR